MKLQGRPLELNLRGDDVALLQTELRLLDLTVTDPPGLFGSTTLLAVRRFQTEHQLPATGVVDARTARRINQAVDALPRTSWRVQGRLLQVDGSVPTAARVRAFEKRLRRDLQLGEAVPDAAGAWQIDYPVPRNGEISLQVLAVRGTGERLAEAELICRAGPLEIVDLVVGGPALRGAPLFAKLQAALQPLLSAEHMNAAELDAGDVHWLACRNGLDEIALHRYADAARLAREADLPREHEALFGLLTQGLPAVLPALISQAAPSLRRALAQSVADNVVAPALTPRIEAVVEALQRVVVLLALRDPQPDRPTYALLFELAGTPAEHRAAVLDEHLRRSGTLADYWQAQRHRLGDDAVAELQHVLGLSALCLNHEPLLRELMRRRAAGTVGRSIADLARFDRDDWLRLTLQGTGPARIGAPTLLGRDSGARNQLYATYLARFVEATAPTRVLVERLGRDTPVSLAAAVALLRREPGLDLATGRVGDYLRAHPQALTGEADPAATRAALNVVQRLYDLAPPFDKHRTVRLAAQGVTSATQIRRLGETSFVAQAAAPLGGEQQARAVYALAAHKADAAALLLSQSAFIDRTPLPALPSQWMGAGIPDLADLFGSLDGCACRHCNSVYGPAAYLVDVLHFLMNCRSSRPGHSALDILFERRPDIGAIDLDCGNTETSLPYVDLVIEILENAVAPGGGFPFQTTGDSVDLLASPAQVNAAAYDAQHLAGAMYPWSLPFDMWMAVARTYLQHLGVPRDELMRCLRGPADAAAEADIAAEVLALSPVDRQALRATAAAERRATWGFADATDFDAFVGARNVAALLARARLDYDALAAALATRFVDPAGNLRIEFADADCNVSNATVVNLDAQALDRLQCFMRLQRRLAWTIPELGALLQTLDITALDDPALIRVAAVQGLQQAAGVPLERLLAWWAPRLDTHGVGGRQSLYEQVFLDPSAGVPSMHLFRLNAARNELAEAATATISAHLPQVHAALGVSAGDLELMRSGLPNDRLDLANLTRLHAAASLARALGLGVAAYLSLVALSGLTPIGPAAGPAATVRFAELAADPALAPAALPLLDYLLRHRHAANAAYALADDEIAARLARLRTALRAVDAAYALAPPGVDTTTPGFEADPDGTRTAIQLAALLPDDAVRLTLALIEQDAVHAPADPAAFVQQWLADFLDPVQAVAALVGPGALTQRAERLNFVLAAALQRRRADAREAEAVGYAVEALAIEPEVAGLLLRELVRSPADASLPLITDLVDEALIGAPTDGPPTPAQLARDSLPRQYAALERLHKLAQALTLIGVPSAHIATTVAQGPSRGWPDLATLPLQALDEVQPVFDAWLAMARAWRAGAALPGGLADFHALLEMQQAPGVGRPAFIDELTLRGGWDRAWVEAVTGDEVLALAWPQDFRSGAFLTLLQVRITLLQRLGVPPDTARSWSGATVSATAAQTLLQTARAKYPQAEAWLAIARPLRNPLREHQRAALVDYLVHMMGLGSAGDLYGRFLVDVEMSPCMLSSRLVLATGSVQLFVQRCLLNLEPDVPPPAIDSGQWGWMKSFRVWEANRKVFLYPENYLEPELRSDKTPFFTSLEQGLLQDEIDAPTVEREYLRYLESLNQVAHLEITAMAVAPDGARKDAVHLFGRSRSEPRLHYHRRWDHRSWTPWEALDAGIEGRHLLPAIWNGRLHLFWPVFMDKALEPAAEEIDPDHPASPIKYHDVTLAWSEFREGRWSPKKMSDGAISSAIRWGGPGQTLRVHEPALHQSMVVSPADGGCIEIGMLVRPPGLLAPGVFEHTYTQAFRLTGTGDVEVVAAQGTLQERWPPDRQFPYTAPYGNAIRELADGATLIETPERVGLAVLTSSGATGDQAVPVLGRSPGRFTLVMPAGERPFFCRLPFFMQDRTRAFFVVPDGRYISSGGGPLLGEIGAALPAPQNAPTPAVLPSPDLPLRVAAFHAEVASTTLTATPGTGAATSLLPGHWQTTSLRFHGHQHPLVGLLIEQLNRHGIAGILAPSARMEPARTGAFETLRRQRLFRPYFFADYQPTEVVENLPDIAPGLIGGIEAIAALRAMLPREEFDFSHAGAYSIYNWELFFHAPLLIAKRLSANRRFDDAHRWFNYLFDPTTGDGGSPVATQAWQVRPFFEHGQGRTIERLLLLLRQTGLSKSQRQQRDELNQQIEAWRAQPFDPHLIARLRVQPYMMAVVMAYLDNLIAWGDDLFRRDTMESVNEASQLYLLAAAVLGERPRDTDAHDGARREIEGHEVRGFNDLRPHLDRFSNALVELETTLYPSQSDRGAGGSGGLLQASDFAAAASPDSGQLGSFGYAAATPALIGSTLFFCVPRNDRLLSCWDTVADRLFKIRHCMNIEGVLRQLPLFQPPIDPALLVRAAAAGVDIAAAVADAQLPLPRYRFATLLQKAREMAASVRALGAALLSALEKKDAETLSLLRARHETELFEQMRASRQAALQEARAGVASLDASRPIIALRRTYYRSRQRTNAKEALQQRKLKNAFALQTTSQAVELLAGALTMIPQFNAGASGAFGTPVITAEIGGAQFSAAVQVASRALQLAAAIETYESNKAAIEAGFDRRQDEWTLQGDLADAEMTLLNRQLEAARLRVALAETELATQERQIAHSLEIAAQMNAKYTNQELHGWMIGQLSALHFQSYQLAMETARRAERCFRFELGLGQSAYVAVGHWDSLRKGLLAGEKLELDLQRMEAAYLEQHRREYEMNRHVSLRRLEPLQLLNLKATGECEFELPEWLFDLDAPGHFMRRIKSVGLSLPCVVGPQVSVNCTLRLVASRVRHSTVVAGGYAQAGAEDARFTADQGLMQSVVTSTASNDSGLFEANLRDERYLPFEGCGAIGRWRLELPREFRQFDYTTIADAVLHLRYTARDGGAQLRQAAVTALGELLAGEDEGQSGGGSILLSLRQDYPGEWQRYLAGQPLSLVLGRQHFPYLAQGRDIAVTAADLALLDPAAPAITALTAQQLGLDTLPAFASNADAPVTLRLADDVTALPRNAAAHAFLLLGYRLS